MSNIIKLSVYLNPHSAKIPLEPTTKLRFASVKEQSVCVFITDNLIIYTRQFVVKTLQYKYERNKVL